MMNSDTTLTIIYAAFAFGVLLNVPSIIRSIMVYRRKGDFKCKGCGNCCRFRVTPLLAEDVKRLEAAGYRDFTANVKGELSTKRVGGRCIFLKDDRCTAYEHRPTVCREFPFFKEYGIGYGRRLSFCPAMEELDGRRG